MSCTISSTQYPWPYPYPPQPQPQALPIPTHSNHHPATLFHRPLGLHRHQRLFLLRSHIQRQHFQFRTAFLLQRHLFLSHLYHNRPPLLHHKHQHLQQRLPLPTTYHTYLGPTPRRMETTSLLSFPCSTTVSTTSHRPGRRIFCRGPQPTHQPRAQHRTAHASTPDATASKDHPHPTTPAPTHTDSHRNTSQNFSTTSPYHGHCLGHTDHASCPSQQATPSSTSRSPQTPLERPLRQALPSRAHQIDLPPGTIHLLFLPFTPGADHAPTA